MFLDWSLKTEEDKISYDEIKMSVQDQDGVSEDENLPYGQNTTDFIWNNVLPFTPLPSLPFLLLSEKDMVGWC